MLKFHTDRKSLATLAVQDRETSRYLLFDESLQLCGRQAGRDGKQELVRAAKKALPLAFSGIHVISPQFLAMMSEQGAFSIIDSYLRVAKAGEKILGFRADSFYWRDLGRPENVAQAAADIEMKRILLAN
jgi:NDP-sugar pyrophosphorylase family protein